MNLVSSARRLAIMNREELRFRVQCEARKTVERARYAFAPPRWRRSAIVSLLNPSSSVYVIDAREAASRGDFVAAHRALARHFRSRRSAWPIGARDRHALGSAVRRRFPDAARNAADCADRLTDGLRDLLGYRDVQCGVPPDWHRDPVHGARSPQAFWANVPYLDPAYGDHKIIWELNRHQHWRTLGRAFWLTDNYRYRDAFITELDSWLKANPPGTGINWASTLELGFRAMSWTWALEFFSADAGEDTTPWLVDLLIALDRQLAQISRHLSLYFSPNTHLTGEALALYAVSRAFPELRGSAVRGRLGRDVLLRECQRQIRADGGHVEQSPHYHRYSTDFYLLALLVARASGDTAADQFENTVRAQAQYLRTVADDQGRLPLIGDDDGGQLFGMCGGRPADASDTLATAAAVLEDLTLAVKPASEEVYWILGRPPAASVAQGARMPWPSRMLAASGYFVARTSESDHLVFDAGPHGFLNGGHAHSDALSIVLTVAGEPLLVDPGTATYTMDAAARDRFRSTRMHNTVVIDGRDHVEPDGPFHWRGSSDARMLASRIAPRFDFAQATHDAYGTHTHVRSVVALHGLGWVVVDQILGSGEVSAESWWHLHPRWRPSLGRRSVLSLRGADGSNRAMAFTATDIEHFSASDFAEFAPEYGRVEPSPTVRVTERRATPFAIGTFIPARALFVDPLAIASVGLETPPPDGWVGAAFSVQAGPAALIILVASPRGDSTSNILGSRWGTSTAQTDARALVLRRDGSEFETLAIVGGETVRTRQMASAVHADDAAMVGAPANAVD